MKRSNFESLFLSALKEWPESLNLADLEYQEGGRYSVVGLGRHLEKIDSGHIGGKEEVIWRELHWAIFTVVHSVAKNLSDVKLSSLRPEAVQQVFDRRLQSAIAAKDPAWDAEDFALAQSYLQEGIS